MLVILLISYISPLLGFTNLDHDANRYIVSQPSCFKIYIATVRLFIILILLLLLMLNVSEVLTGIYSI